MELRFFCLFERMITWILNLANADLRGLATLAFYLAGNSLFELYNFFILLEAIYQAWDAVFCHQMKHWEESWKYEVQRNIFDELWGVSSGDETLCRMLDITSQTKWF